MSLEIRQGIQKQGAEDSWAYILNVENVSSAPSSPAVPYIYDVGSRESCKSRVMPVGTPSVSGTQIQLPLLTALTPGSQYNVWVTWVDGDETKSAILRVKCTELWE